MDPKAIFENFRLVLTRHYFDMGGRVGRTEFWYFMLCCFLIEIVAGMIQAFTFFIVPLGAIAALALLLPMAGMGARRLQDTGRDGNLVWALILPSLVMQAFALLAWGPLGFFAFLAFYATIGMLINLVVLAATIALIYFWIQPGDAAPNRYGPPPPQPLAAPAF